MRVAARLPPTIDAPASVGFTPEAAETADEQVGLPWLVRLRWGAVAGQALALLIAGLLLALELPWITLAALIAFTALTNLCLGLVPASARRDWFTPVVLVIDVLVLTVMLTVSGGASNPFTVFFLVHVALAALLLKPRLAWSVLGLTVVAFASLFVPRAPASHEHHDHGHGGAWSMHLVGMWVAYALAASFVAHFVSRVSRAIRERDRRIAEVKHLAVQNERLAMLSAFSANAAHELGTPLGTIGLAARELSLGLARGADAATLAADAELVCDEVARCRSILSELSSRAGESIGEMPVATTPRRLIEGLRAALSPAHTAGLDVAFDGGCETLGVVAPPRTLAQLLTNLVRNAFEAHEAAGVDEPVELRVSHVGGRICFRVRDRGPGLSPDLASRLGEPFVTTKGDHGGLGLGVYLARSYAERTGGHLRFERRDGGGTEVELCLPRDVVRGR